MCKGAGPFFAKYWMSFMIVHLKDIPAEGLDLNFSLAPSQLPQLREDAELSSPVAVHAAIKVIRRNILINGEIACGVLLDCSRCLSRFEEKFNFPFCITYSPLPTRGVSPEKELSWDDLEVTFYEEEELDVGAVVREELILALPVHALCQESCKGLCVGCGADLNCEPCRCAALGVDPRLARLADFFKR